MEDSQDRQEAAEGGLLPEEAPPAEMTGGGLDDAVPQDPVDDAQVDDAAPVPDADEGEDLADVVAALDEPEQQSSDAAEAEDAAEGQLVTEADADAPEVDPELAALQADLDAETPEGQAETSESAEEAQPAESVSDDAQVAVAGEQVASADTKDIMLPDDRAGVPVWPFAMYFALWVAFAGLLVWQFMATPAGTPIYELDLYRISILVGLGLTAIGPLLALGVWLTAWLARPTGRAGLFSRTFIIGAVTTLAGVALWLIALGAVDMLRLGRLL